MFASTHYVCCLCLVLHSKSFFLMSLYSSDFAQLFHNESLSKRQFSLSSCILVLHKVKLLLKVKCCFNLFINNTFSRTKSQGAMVKRRMMFWLQSAIIYRRARGSVLCTHCT